MQPIRQRKVLTDARRQVGDEVQKGRDSAEMVSAGEVEFEC